jgi:2-oxoglutarate dehydrogenase E2 component (dihydrolipoamide succinyltransferase)
MVVVGAIRVYVAHRARYIRARLILIAILTVYSMSNLFYGHVIMNVAGPPASRPGQAASRATQAPAEPAPTARPAPDAGTASSASARASARVRPQRPTRQIKQAPTARSPSVRSTPDPEAVQRAEARREAHLSELRQGEPEEVRTIDLEDGTSTDDLLLVMEQGSVFRKVDALNMLNARGVRTPRFYQAAAMMLRDPNAITSDLLKRAGPVAEDAVLKVLRESRDSRTKVVAIGVLRAIGTEKSLLDLTEAMGSPDSFVSNNATSAAESVRRRAARASGGDSTVAPNREAERAP